MDDTNSTGIELSKGEAREVINALSEYETRATGRREEERVLNVESLLQREFDFDEGQTGGGGDRNISDVFSNIFDDDGGTHEIQLSRTEATEIVRALDDFDGQESRGETETVTNVRDRFVRTFDVDDVDDERSAGR
ncbi:hypothetical protein [Halopelagius longus]|uniref:Uncharacterized protein n=1 Tax=Halopelagius longus TaxID=1236180 RepID=A0A1H0YG94_9EURY|nr:hypothetical protein [Halopelagius longus]RDI72478.1 hypothetical protein DWB78_12540 [Halopelagius longus]SDQ14294.1 hypothetical protein SAMN05216278_0623 [Halopelagius longus]